MDIGIDFSSIDSIEKKLKEMGNKGKKLKDIALNEGAQIILNEMEKTRSFKDRSGKLRKGLKLSKATNFKGARVIKIGVQKSDNSKIFYAKMLEWGTSKMSARPFMRPAYEKKRKEALEKTKSVLRQSLK